MATKESECPIIFHVLKSGGSLGATVTSAVSLKGQEEQGLD